MYISAVLDHDHCISIMATQPQLDQLLRYCCIFEASKVCPFAERNAFIVPVAVLTMAAPSISRSRGVVIVVRMIGHMLWLSKDADSDGTSMACLGLIVNANQFRSENRCWHASRGVAVLESSISHE